MNPPAPPPQKQPAKEGPTAKPKGSFDLRRVTSVKQVHPEDTSAPPYAIEARRSLQ